MASLIKTLAILGLDRLEEALPKPLALCIQGTREAADALLRRFRTLADPLTEREVLDHLDQPRTFEEILGAMNTDRISKGELPFKEGSLIRDPLRIRHMLERLCLGGTVSTQENAGNDKASGKTYYIH